MTPTFHPPGVSAILAETTTSVQPKAKAPVADLARLSLALSESDPSSSIQLPHGLRIPRPTVEPNPALYTRLPCMSSPSAMLPLGSHLSCNCFDSSFLTFLYCRVLAYLIQKDGTPNYLPLLLTSSVYSILPAGGTPLTPATSVSSQRLFFGSRL